MMHKSKISGSVAYYLYLLWYFFGAAMGADAFCTYFGDVYFHRLSSAIGGIVLIAFLFLAAFNLETIRFIKVVGIVLGMAAINVAVHFLWDILLAKMGLLSLLMIVVAVGIAVVIWFLNLRVIEDTLKRITGIG